MDLAKRKPLRLRRPAVPVILLLACGALPAAAAEAKLETRCGWFANPTPGNLWLTDRAGEWTIGVQGGHQAGGDWDWPEFPPRQWIKQNGDYGYGCACFKLRADPKTRNVLFVQKAWARPLSACKNDTALKNAEPPP
jgi:hypothetical protein